MHFVCRNCNTASCNSFTKFLCGYIFFFSHYFHLRCYNTLFSGIHLCCIIHIYISSFFLLSIKKCSQKESCFQNPVTALPAYGQWVEVKLPLSRKAPLLCGYYILILTHCQGNITQMLIKFSRLKIQYVLYYNIVTDRRKFYENDKRHIFKNHKIYIENYR